MKKVLCFIMICLLLPGCALAETRRGDWGEEVYEIQQLLFDTGFLFEEPDGKFGRKTEDAVKWFQEVWNLPVTGVVTEEDRWQWLTAGTACSIRTARPSRVNRCDDQLEPQPLSPDIQGTMPSETIEGDPPVCCIRYMETDGSEHIEYCGRHAMIAESVDLMNLTGTQPETPACQQWEDAIKALYDEWMRASEEEEQPMIASSQATFLFWINQQRMTLIMQGDENVESKLEPVLRSQCVELCAIVHGSQE